MQFALNLRIFAVQRFAAQEAPHVVQADRNPPLVDHAAVLFLQFRENQRVLHRRTIGAKPEFHLVLRPLNRPADQRIIIGVIIQIADGMLPILVNRHIPCGQIPHQRLRLRMGEDEFLFHPFKGTLNARHQRSPPFVLLAEMMILPFCVRKRFAM